MVMELQFTRRFSMAHRLSEGAAARCETPHGHNEFVSVRLTPRGGFHLDGARNMMVEFSEAKGRWHRFVDEHLDHALQLSDRDPFVKLVETHYPDWRLVLTPGDPTTELMASLLACKCQAILDEVGTPLVVSGLTLQETPTNSVVLGSGAIGFAEQLADGNTSGWWRRGDFSTR